MSVAQRFLAKKATSKCQPTIPFQVKNCAKTRQNIESYLYFSFRCIDGTGQLNFGFAADAIANNDHFLSLSVGPQYNGIVSLLVIRGF